MLLEGKRLGRYHIEEFIRGVVMGKFIRRMMITSSEQWLLRLFLIILILAKPMKH
jgi:hypothetical protein